MLKKRTVLRWLDMMWIVMISACLPAFASKPHTKICRVHHVVLQKDKVPVLYGASAWDEPARILREAGKKLFPNANSFVEGDCMAPAEQEFVEVLFCPECRKAADAYQVAWMQEFYPGVVSDRAVAANIEKALKTLQQMKTLLDSLEQRQSQPQKSKVFTGYPEGYFKNKRPLSRPQYSYKAS